VNKLIPESPAEPCGGYSKPKDPAILAVAKSIELATDLRITVDEMTKSGPPPIAPHRPGFDPMAWRVLVAYLIEERRLTEFLLGPGVYKDKGVARYQHADDICLDCFASADQRWRFIDEKVRTELHNRATRINKRLAHFSWTLTENDPRSDSGVWKTHYLNLITLGLLKFADHLETNGSSALANVLRQSVKSDTLASSRIPTN
jgi:hypothetical protein